jgi:hypothetical protein
VICSVPIYLSSKFQGIWRPSSSGPKFEGLVVLGGHNSIGGFNIRRSLPLVFRFDILGGDSNHPDLQFEIFSIAFGGLLHQG